MVVRLKDIVNTTYENCNVENELNVLEDCECCDTASLSNDVYLLIVTIAMEDKSEY